MRGTRCELTEHIAASPQQGVIASLSKTKVGNNQYEKLPTRRMTLLPRGLMPSFFSYVTGSHRSG